MVTRSQLQARITQAKKNISSKMSQIKITKKKSRFRGVTIKKQFKVGRQGIKPFRKRRKAERRGFLFDVGIFNSQLPGLRDSLKISEEDLAAFDLLEGEI